MADNKEEISGLGEKRDVKRRSLYDEDSLDGDNPYDLQGRESVGSAKDTDRVKLVRDRQNEERQRKLEELRQQALAAQRFREQREEERRKRIDDLRSRDNDRRNQVEERKRLIWEAERERREAILRKNQEREARIEAKKKNERSHIVFAFGSSTPRMLEPADTGGSTFWGTRRATSTTNVMMFTAAQPLTRRSSERELDGSKKRATSAGGLDRKPGEGEDIDGSPGTPSSAYLRVNRRRTDLMPTIPSPRDAIPPSTGRSSSSSKAFTRSPGIHSGEVTPSSPSRPHSSLSQQSGSSVGSSNVSLRPRTTTPRRPRPASIAGTGVTVTEQRHNFIGDLKVTKDSKPPLPKVHSTPKKPSTPKPAEVAKKPMDKLIKSAKASPRITPRATPLQSPGSEQPPIIQTDVAEIIKQDASHVKEFDTAISEKFDEKRDLGNEKTEESTAPETNVVIAEATSNQMPEVDQAQLPTTAPSVSVQPEAVKSEKEEVKLSIKEAHAASPAPQPIPEKKEAEKKTEKKSPEPEQKLEVESEEPVDMSASMIAKTRITTEEEAKAALAERRRLAREQAEREAELERQRIEEEERLEEERQRAEEEEQRRLEEESLRLASEARQAEEQRLRLAIEEAQRREEEDRKRREEEARQKVEKEEAEKKAREEAEKQRIEMAERLKKEEEERIARRKRVEAIMLRTRGKNQPNTPTKGEGGDGDKLKEDSSPGDENKSLSVDKVGDVMTASLISAATEQFIVGEQQALHIEHNSVTPTAPDVVLRNGSSKHTNGVNSGENGSNNSPTEIIDNGTPQNQQQGNGEGEINGHTGRRNDATNLSTTTARGNLGNGIDSLINEPIALDNATVKQNNATNNLLDFSDFEDLTTSNTSSGTILELTAATTPKLADEDSINSNLNPTAIAFNPLANPFVSVSTNANDNTNPFGQDSFPNNKTAQDNNQVPDLLS